MDERLCERFHKRLRIDGPDNLSSYLAVNYFLQRLHGEQVQRRQSNDASVPMEDVARLCLDAGRTPRPMTRYTLTDVVQCTHGQGGRCLMCSGRFVQDIPLELSTSFNSAYDSATSSSSSSVSSVLRGDAQLSLAALASLFACLAPEPSDRLLHLGSGVGRAVLAWALLLPQNVGSGVETCYASHRAASNAAERLQTHVQRRLFLHHSNIFDLQGDWHQANIIFVTPSGFNEDWMRTVVEGLQHMRSGTRIVSFSHPLCTVPNQAPMGFVFAREAAYRTTGSGNVTAFIYRKL